MERSKNKEFIWMSIGLVISASIVFILIFFQSGNNTKQSNIHEVFDGWIKSVGDFDLDGNVNYYSEKVNYFGRTISKAQIRQDKKRFFDVYDQCLRNRYDNLSILFNDKTKCTTEFDLTFDFRSSRTNKKFSASVRKEVSWTLQAGGWKIISEKDKKVLGASSNRPREAESSKSLDDPCQTISLSSIGDVGVFVHEAQIPAPIVSMARSSDITNSFEQVGAYIYDLDGDGCNEYFVINGVAGGATHFVTALFVFRSNQWAISKKEISNPQVIPGTHDGTFFEIFQSGNKWESPPIIRVPYSLIKGFVNQTGPPCRLESN
jgi:ketosteroid isomerase-like protein